MRIPAKQRRGTIFLTFTGLVLGFLLVLGGCAAVGPDYKKPKTEVPAKWQDLKDPALVPGMGDIRTWWTLFNDPVLNQLIEKANKGNLDLKTALAKVQEARARVGVARGDELPSLNASGDTIHQRGSEHEIGGGGVTYTRYSAGLDSSWEIDLFGRIRRSVEAANADYQASQEDRIDVMIRLYAEVARTYLTVRTTQAQLHITRKNIISQKQVLELTRIRFRNGLATDLDVSQAESVLASTQANLPPLRINLAQAVHALSLLLGKHPGALRKLLAKAKPIPVPPAKVLTGVPADIMRQRPDVRKAERQLAAETARIGVATADLYPSFSLTGTIGLASTNTNNLFNASSNFFTIGPQFQWNLFQGGRIRAQIKVQDAITEQALYTYEQAILTALGEVEDALVSFVEQRRRKLALESTVSAARRTLKLALQLYKDGLKDFQSVLDAQRSLLDYENQLVQTEGETANSLVQLYKTLGGGWQVRNPKKDSQPAKPRTLAKKQS